MASQKRSLTKTKSASKKKSNLPVLEKSNSKIYKIMKEIIKADSGFERIIKSCNNVTTELRKENAVLI